MDDDGKTPVRNGYGIKVKEQHIVRLTKTPVAAADVPADAPNAVREFTVDVQFGRDWVLETTPRMQVMAMSCAHCRRLG